MPATGTRTSSSVISGSSYWPGDRRHRPAAALAVAVAVAAAATAAVVVQVVPAILVVAGLSATLLRCWPAGSDGCPDGLAAAGHPGCWPPCWRFCCRWLPLLAALVLAALLAALAVALSRSRRCRPRASGPHRLPVAAADSPAADVAARRTGRRCRCSGALAAAASLVLDTGGATVTLLPPLGRRLVRAVGLASPISGPRGRWSPVGARRRGRAGGPARSRALGRGAVPGRRTAALARRMASTRSLLRILPVPDRPRSDARAWSCGGAARTGCRCGCLCRHSWCRLHGQTRWRSGWYRSRGSFPLRAETGVHRRPRGHAGPVLGGPRTGASGKSMSLGPGRVTVGPRNRAALTLVRANRSNQNMGGAPGLRVRRCCTNLTLPEPPASLTGNQRSTSGRRRLRLGLRSGSDPTAGALVRDAGRQRPPAGGGLAPAASLGSLARGRRRRPRTARARWARRRSRPQQGSWPRTAGHELGVSRHRGRSRYCWCSQSSVAGISRSGSTVMAWTSSAARPAVRAASPCGTIAGSTERACVVASRWSGTNTTGSIEGCGQRGSRGRARWSAGRRRSTAIGQAAEAAPPRRCPGVPPGHTRQRAASRVRSSPPASRSATTTPGDHGRGRRAQPAAVRDRVVRRSAARASRQAPRRRVAARIGLDDQVLPVERDVPGTLAVDRDLQTRLVEHLGRRRRRRGPGPDRGVEARAEVGAGRGNPYGATLSDADRGPRRRGHVSPRGRAPLPPSSHRRGTRTGCTDRRRVDRPLGVLQAMTGDGAHHALARRQPTRRVHRDQPGDAGRGGRLDEDALLGGEHPVRGEDLLVGHRLDQPTGLVAGGDRQLPRRRVADPDRRGDRSPAWSTGCPSTIGAAPAAWKPHIAGASSRRGPSAAYSW